MFKSLDVLIGFSAIMLLLSVAVTMLTQAITGALGSRGRHLLGGIVTILNQIDPKITPYCARQIGRAVLRHPLVGHGRLATVIQRDELTRILLELAAGREPGGKALDEVARSTLKKALENNGIMDAAGALENIHLLALKLEALQPELPAPARHALAIVTEAPSQFVGRIHACFDETMDRVTQRFTRHTRTVAAAMGMVVAAGLQLDAFDVLKRLASDDAARASLAALAADLEKSPAPDQSRLAEIRKLAESGYGVVPEDWEKDWRREKIPGIALSAILLSLGAPFWYNALKDLVGLRPVLARKEQAHREQRQSVRDAALPPAPSPAAGEKGDLTAAGAVG